MAADGEQSWEDILEERLGGEKPDKPVRLSDLAPPAGLKAGRARGNPGFTRAPPAPTAPTERAGLPPSAAPSPEDPFDLAWKEQAMASDVVAELNDKLRESEEARREAQARLAGVEWELTDLRERLGMSEEARRGAEVRAGDSARAPLAGGRAAPDSPVAPADPRAGAAHDGNGSSNGEVAHLRRQLEEAYSIIRAIEAAYLAGESRRGNGRSGK
ncbi:MAG: hypothetical protein ACYSU0_10015 [Planctomycetota bacterium]|jgi:hypothetical protein